MKSNKERILRNLEYIEGGITVLKTLCDAADNSINTSHYEIFSDWQDILYETIDMIEEDTDNA